MADAPRIFEHIAIARNDPMNAWDVQVLFGGFKTEADARRFARDLAELLEEHSNFKGDFVQ